MPASGDDVSINTASAATITIRSGDTIAYTGFVSDRLVERHAHRLAEHDAGNKENPKEQPEVLQPGQRGLVQPRLENLFRRP